LVRLLQARPGDLEHLLSQQLDMDLISTLQQLQELATVSGEQDTDLSMLLPILDNITSSQRTWTLNKVDRVVWQRLSRPCRD